MQSKTEGREKSFLFFFSQAPDGESQPSTEVDLFISTEKIMVLNTDLKVNLKFKWCSFEILIKCIGIYSENRSQNFLITSRERQKFQFPFGVVQQVKAAGALFDLCMK